MKNSRLTAFEVINGVLRENAYSNLSLEKALDGAENKDKAFVTRLVYGVLERKLTLDYVINIYLKSKTKPKIKNFCCIWVPIRYCLWIKYPILRL